MKRQRITTYEFLLPEIQEIIQSVAFKQHREDNEVYGLANVDSVKISHETLPVDFKIKVTITDES